jgi:hypothetical protein
MIETIEKMSREDPDARVRKDANLAVQRLRSAIKKSTQ